MRTSAPIGGLGASVISGVEPGTGYAASAIVPSKWMVRSGVAKGLRGERRRSPRSSDGREEARRGALGAGDLVEGGREVHPPSGQRAEARQALHDDDARAEDHPVHREVLRGEVGQPGAVLFEEIEADVLRAPRDRKSTRLNSSH